jgi:hypothetical protein
VEAQYDRKCAPWYVAARQIQLFGGEKAYTSIEPQQQECNKTSNVKKRNVGLQDERYGRKQDIEM